MGMAELTQAPDTGRVVVVGSGQDGGVPQFGGPEVAVQRTASSLLVTAPSGATFLFDASPDIVKQSRGSSFDPNTLSGVLLTHGHMGHYIGLAHFGNEAAATDRVACFGTHSMFRFLSRNEPWKTLFVREHLVYNVLVPGVETQVDETLSVTAHLVPHRAEFTDTVGYVVTNLVAGGSILYLPDIDRWDAWPQARSVVSNVDIAFLDASFSSADEVPGRNIEDMPHPLVPDTVALFMGLDTQIVLTHINHSNSLGASEHLVTRDAIRNGFLVAYDGATYEF